MSGYRGVLFDLFGTLITFSYTRLPEFEIHGQRMRSSAALLGPELAHWLPGTSLAEFFTTLVQVSDELARRRAYDHIEVPSRERFRLALERLGCDERAQPEAAIALSRAHMRVIAQVTEFPPEHRALLAALYGRYRLGLVSNFDDTATVYEILQRHDILRHLDTVVVSEALALRKPHPAVVRIALAGLGLAAKEVLFVGDTFAEDVRGAQAAGVDVAWIDARRQGTPADSPPPHYTIGALPELRAILGEPLG